MSIDEYIAFIDLLMCSDPYPCWGEETLKDMADRQAREYGFTNWIDAWHRIERV